MNGTTKRRATLAHEFGMAENPIAFKNLLAAAGLEDKAEYTSEEEELLLNVATEELPLGAPTARRTAPQLLGNGQATPKQQTFTPTSFSNVLDEIFAIQEASIDAEMAQAEERSKARLDELFRQRIQNVRNHQLYLSSPEVFTRMWEESQYRYLPSEV